MLRDDYKRNPLTWYQQPKSRKKDREKQEQFCIFYYKEQVYQGIIDDPRAENYEKSETKNQPKQDPINIKPQEYEIYKDPEDQNYQYCFPPPEIVKQLKYSTKFFSMPEKRSRKKQTKQPEAQMTVQNCYNSPLVQQQLAEEKNKHRNDITLEQILDNLESGAPLKTQEHKDKMEKNFQVQKDFQDKLTQYKESRKFNLNLKEKHASYCFPFKPSFKIPMREVSMLDQYCDDDDDEEDENIYANVPKKYFKPIQKDKNSENNGQKKKIAKQKPLGHQWKCLGCGYINSGFSRNCEICNAVQFY